MVYVGLLNMFWDYWRLVRAMFPNVREGLILFLGGRMHYVDKVLQKMQWMFQKSMTFYK